MSTREVILIGVSPAMSTAQDDDSLLRQVEALVHQHTRLVLRIAYSVLLNQHDAEDAAQEVFVRVLRYRAQLARVEDAKSWLAQIAWRIATESKRRAPKVDDVAILANAADSSLSAEAALGDEQMQSMLKAFIAQLEPDLRDVITLSTVQELNSRQIGEILAVPEATVRTRQMRARQVLKEKFAAAMKPR